MTIRDALRGGLRPAVAVRKRVRGGGGGAPAGLRFASAFGRISDAMGQSASSTGTLTIPIRTLTAVGTTATATVDTTAMMVTGQMVDVASASVAAYNGAFAVTVINGTQFTYTTATTPSGAATGATVKMARSTPMSAISQGAITSSGTTVIIAHAKTRAIQVGDQILVLGCTEPQFNGLQTVTAVNQDVDFRYTFSGNSNNPPTGSPLVFHMERKAGAAEIVFTLGSSDWSELRAMFTNFAFGFFPGCGVAGGVVGTLSTWTIDECAITIGSTAYAKVKFGGSLTKTVTPSDSKIVSDAITAADFIDNAGNPVAVSLTRGTVGSIKLKVSFSSINTFLPGRSNSGLRGSAYSYNPATPAAFRVNSVYAVGAMTVVDPTGFAGHVYGTNVPPPYTELLGVPTSSSAKVFMSAGDSITQGEGDTDNVDNSGVTSSGASKGRRGWFTRSMWDTSFTNATAYAGFNSAISSGWADMYQGAYQGAAVSWYNDLIDYCTHYVEAGGTNSSALPNTRVLWATVRGKGKYLVRTSLHPRTTSTDSFATTANQTPVAQWGVGSNSDTNEDTYVNETNNPSFPNGPTHYLQFTVHRASSAGDQTDPLYWKWKVNGTAFYTTVDGLHGSPVGYGLMAGEARTFWASLP